MEEHFNVALSSSPPRVIIQLIFFFTSGACYRSSNNNLSWPLVPLQHGFCETRGKVLCFMIYGAYLTCAYQRDLQNAMQPSEIDCSPALRWKCEHGFQRRWKSLLCFNRNKTQSGVNNCVSMCSTFATIQHTFGLLKFSFRGQRDRNIRLIH